MIKTKTKTKNIMQRGKKNLAESRSWTISGEGRLREQSATPQRIKLMGKVQ